MARETPPAKVLRRTLRETARNLILNIGRKERKGTNRLSFSPLMKTVLNDKKLLTSEDPCQEDPIRVHAA